MIGRGGGVKGNQHLHYKQDTPHANILVTHARPRRRAGEGIREVRRQHRRLLRSVTGCDAGVGSDLQISRVARAIAAGVVAVACCMMSPRSAAARPAARPRSAGQGRRQPSQCRRQHAAAVGRLQRRRRRGAAAAATPAPTSTLANNYGATPMSLAAEVGNTDMLKRAARGRRERDSPNADGQTALMAVARTGNVEGREAAARARRDRRCAREVRRTDRADVGVGAPASGDDASC